MNQSAIVPYQQAAYAALKADATLQALTPRWYDRVPAGAVLPYGRLGEMTEIGLETMGRSGAEPTLTVHVFSESQDKKEVGDILSRVRAVLHNTKLAIAGFSTLRVACELVDISEEPDPLSPDRRLFHGRARFRATVWA